MIINIENRKVKISNDVLSYIYSKRQTDANDCESGGMLIGSIIRGTKDIIIEDLTLPIKEDKCTRTSYVRSEEHNKLLEQKWIDSQYTKMYFGEWHTHPQINPFPSSRDIKNWKNLMRQSETETEILIFIIAGINLLKIWIGDRKGMKIYQVFGGDYNGLKMVSCSY